MKRADLPATLKPMPAQSRPEGFPLLFVSVDDPRALQDEANTCLWRAKELADALAFVEIKEASDDALRAFAAVMAKLLGDAAALLELLESARLEKKQ